MKEEENLEIEEYFTQSSGEMLRQARLAKELSISEISRSTRISKSMIQALENGEVENLPGRTYEIGYIKLICSVTETNSKPIIDKWVNEYYFQKPLDPYIFPDAKAPKENSIIVIVGLILSLFIVLSYAGWYFYSINELSEENIEQEENDVNLNLLSQYNEGTKINDNENATFKLSGKKSSKSLLSSKNQVSENLINKKIENTSLQDNNSDNLEYGNSNFDLSKNQKSLSLDEGNKNINVINSSEKYNIENYESFSFFGIKDSWLQIISPDGEIFYTGILKNQQNLIVPNNEKLLVTLGNAGAIGLEIIDLGVRPIGQNGEIIQEVKLDYLLKKISYTNENN